MWECNLLTCIEAFRVVVWEVKQILSNHLILIDRDEVEEEEEMLILTIPLYVYISRMLVVIERY